MIIQLLDRLPVLTVFLLFAFVCVACYEAGFRIGRWWQDRMPGEQEGPADVLIGALLGLMAFVLAITMGMAAERFDDRRALVVEEANAITAVYLQSDYLPPAQAEALRDLLRQYVPLRIVEDGGPNLPDVAPAAQVIQAAMWDLVAEAASTGENGDLYSALGESVTELDNVHETRLVTTVHARVPDTVTILLLTGSALALGMVGFNGGLVKQRSILSAAVLIIALGAVTMLVVDLDRPNDGFIEVSQQALRDVRTWIGDQVP